MFNSKKSKLSQYVDPTGELPNVELKISEWYVRHKLFLQKLGIGALLAFCAATVGYSIFAWGYYLIIGYNEDERMMARQTLEFQNYEKLKELYGAAPIEIKDMQVYESAPGRYDFTAKGKNPNSRWVAYASYKFAYDGGETPLAEAIFLPNMERPVVYFGQETSFYPSNIKLVFENIRWRRINPHQLSDVQGFMRERLDFVYENFEFTPESRSAGIPASIIEFDITNNTPYSFWEPKFCVELNSGTGIAGFLYFSLEKLLAGEKRHVDLRSLAPDIEVSEITVYPVFDIFSSSEYLKPGDS